MKNYIRVGEPIPDNWYPEPPVRTHIYDFEVVETVYTNCEKCGQTLFDEEKRIGKCIYCQEGV